MDLWIRSQDREKLVKCNDIAIRSFLFNEIPKYEWCHSIVGYFDKETEYETLGSYKTKERALEVLDEIEKIFDFRIVDKSYQETDLFIKANMFPKFYQMPKE